MKTVQDLKEEYAKSLGEESWSEFKQNYHKGEIEIAMDSIIEKILQPSGKIASMEKPQDVTENGEYIEPNRFESDSEAVLFYSYLEQIKYIEYLENK